MCIYTFAFHVKVFKSAICAELGMQTYSFRGLPYSKTVGLGSAWSNASGSACL